MNNLFLTTLCTNRCPYCFGIGKVKYSRAECTPADFISLADAHFAADFFQANRSISLLGGEPTLHPEFRAITDHFLDRGYKIFLFTNATFGPELRRYLKDKERIFYVVNVNERNTYAAAKWRNVEANLKALQKNITSLALTLYRIDQQPDFIVDLALRHGVKAVKIGIAAPSSDGRNRKIAFSRKHLLAATVLELVKRLSEAGIMPYGECEKLKPCMVEGGFAEQMRAFGWHGHPFKSKQCLEGGNINVGPDLRVWRCFPFQKPVGKLSHFSSPREMRSRIKAYFDPILFQYFPLPKCYDCLYALTHHCEGGCLNRTIERAKRRLTRYFRKDYSTAFDDWKGRNVALAERSPVFSEWVLTEGIMPEPAAKGSDRIDCVVTDLLAEFDPLHPALLDVPQTVAVFPALIQVHAMVVETCRDLTVPGWRRTLWQKDDRVSAGPFPIFETDMRSIRWRRGEVAIDPGGPHRALLLFYTAFAGDGRKIYTSLAPQGFVRLYPIRQERILNIQDAASPRLLPVTDRAASCLDAKSRADIS